MIDASFITLLHDLQGHTLLVDYEKPLLEDSKKLPTEYIDHSECCSHMKDTASLGPMRPCALIYDSMEEWKTDERIRLCVWPTIKAMQLDLKRLNDLYEVLVDSALTYDNIKAKWDSSNYVHYEIKLSGWYHGLDFYTYGSPLVFDSVFINGFNPFEGHRGQFKWKEVFPDEQFMMLRFGSINITKLDPIKYNNTLQGLSGGYFDSKPTGASAFLINTQQLLKVKFEHEPNQCDICWETGYVLDESHVVASLLDALKKGQ